MVFVCSRVFFCVCLCVEGCALCVVCDVHACLSVRDDLSESRSYEWGKVVVWRQATRTMKERDAFSTLTQVLPCSHSPQEQLFLNVFYCITYSGRWWNTFFRYITQVGQKQN